jgi:hypothetical protein
MHRVLQISMAALLLIQAVSGSCWQPARSCIDRETPACHIAAIADGCDCDDSQNKRPSQDPCNCPLECSGICTFLAPESVQHDFAHLIVAFDWLASQSITVDRQDEFPSLNELIIGCVESELPLRLHLLHQIQLI